LQVVSASGIVETSANKVYGRVDLDDFSLALKWTKIGNFHMSLIQVVNLSNFVHFFFGRHDCLAICRTVLPKNDLFSFMFVPVN
jgi:hypothetical protein